MVEQSSISVAEIATRCGYRDASAMTRAFRKGVFHHAARSESPA
jgi:transcriptional regulator GlxA family with amidase domain